MNSSSNLLCSSWILPKKSLAGDKTLNPKWLPRLDCVTVEENADLEEDEASR